MRNAAKKEEGTSISAIVASGDQNGELTKFKNILMTNEQYKTKSVENKTRVLITAMFLSVALYDRYKLTFQSGFTDKTEFIPSDKRVNICNSKEDVITLKGGGCNKGHDTTQEEPSLATLMHEIGHLLGDKKADDKGQKVDVDKEIETYKKQFGYRDVSVLKTILKDLVPYMSVDNGENYILGKVEDGCISKKAMKEIITDILSDIGEGNAYNKDKSIFYSIKETSPRQIRYGRIPAEQSLDLKAQEEWLKEFEKEKVMENGKVVMEKGQEKYKFITRNYIIPKEKCDNIKTEMGKGNMKSAFDMMMDCINLCFVFKEASISENGQYDPAHYESVSSWANYQIYINDISSSDELIFVGKMAREKNQQLSYDLAIKVDNYVRRQLRLPYRDQKGHMVREADDEILDDKEVRKVLPKEIFEDVRNHVYGEDFKKTDCSEYLKFEQIEKDIINVLSPGIGTNISNIKQLVYNWMYPESDNNNNK